MICVVTHTHISIQTSRVHETALNLRFNISSSPIASSPASSNLISDLSANYQTCMHAHVCACAWKQNILLHITCINYILIFLYAAQALQIGKLINVFLQGFIYWGVQGGSFPPKPPNFPPPPKRFDYVCL